MRDVTSQDGEQSVTACRFCRNGADSTYKDCGKAWPICDACLEQQIGTELERCAECSEWHVEDEVNECGGSGRWLCADCHLALNADSTEPYCDCFATTEPDYDLAADERRFEAGREGA